MKEYRIVTQSPNGIVVVETATDVLKGDAGFMELDNKAHIINRFHADKYLTYVPGTIWIEEREVGPWRRME